MATVQAPRREHDPEGGAAADRHEVTLAALTGLVVTVAGLLIGLQRLQDNSFLTHLATGRLILDSGVPSTDPYTFTAHGEPWTVQSWLASVVYAGIEDGAGLLGLRLLIGVTAAVLAYLCWRLTAPAGAVVARALIVLPVIVIGTDAWTERPLLFGFVGLAALLLLADGHGKAWWCVPMFAIWVNVHGSFPLGLALVGALLVGRLLDREPAHRELSVLGYSCAGVLLGAVNPIGPKLLAFPVELLAKSDVLRFIEEWRPADFGDLTTRILMAQVVVAGLLLLRRRSFRAVLPTVGFFVAALLGSRNIGPASIVAMAGMAPALAGLGGDEGREPKAIFRLGAIAVVAITAVVAIAALLGPHTALDAYPEDAVTWMAGQGLTDPDARVVSRDFVGNYLEARYGTDVQVYMDDRYDMFPATQVHDYIDLVRGDEAWPEIVARARPDAILWDIDTKLFPLLEASDDWTVAYRDDAWAVFLPS